MVTVNKSDHRKVSTQRARLLQVQSRLKELELAHRRGEMVYSVDAAAVLGAVIVAIKGILMAMPGKAALRVVGCSNVGEVKALLDDSVRECLLEIAAIDPPGPEPVKKSRKEVSA